MIRRHAAPRVLSKSRRRRLTRRETQRPALFRFAGEQLEPRLLMAGIPEGTDNDTRETATLLTLAPDSLQPTVIWAGNRVEGAIDSAVDGDHFKFDGLNFDGIVIYTKSLSGSLDTTTTVYNAAGSVLGSDLEGGADNDGANQSFVIDRVPPTFTLISPVAGAISDDLGYIEVKWDPTAPAPLNSSTLDVNDLLVPGVTVDRVEALPNGNVRYWYNDDGQKLPLGQVSVSPQTGQVADQAGNTNAAASAFSFLRFKAACPWQNEEVRYDANFDTFVTPQDALVIINELNRRAIVNSQDQLPSPVTPEPSPPFFYDTNCDTFGTPQDVLVVINELNRRAANSEVESTASNIDTSVSWQSNAESAATLQPVVLVLSSQTGSIPTQRPSREPITEFICLNSTTK